MGALDQRPEHRRVIDSGVGVGHRDHRAVAAGRSRGGAGIEVLLVLLAGRAGTWGSTKPGNTCLPAASTTVDLVRGGKPAGLAELGDPQAVADEDVVGLVEVGAGSRT